MKSRRKKEEKGKVIGFRVVEKECIWMKAGVVNFRLCDNAYDCNSCRFDKAMQEALKSGKTGKTHWADSMKKNTDAENRLCRHVLTGRIDNEKICIHDYNCSDCAFDQWLDEQDIQTAHKPVYRIASGYLLADAYYYHMGHAWARVEHGGTVRVGFDEFAVKLFGAAEAVELPQLGEKVWQNQPGWEFRRGGNKAEMLSPVSGKILAVNQKIVDFPEMIHLDPYREGWLFLLQPESLKPDVKKLYFGDETSNWIETESRKLLSLMGEEYEKLAAAGGRPLEDFYGYYPEVGWQTLVRSFLRT